MLIILEGLDKCGKTTFANKLGPNVVIKHSTKDDDALTILKKYAAIANEQTVVLDRSFLSEMTYGPVYRGEMRITPAKFMQIKKINPIKIQSVRIILVWRGDCYPILTPKSMWVAGGLNCIYYNN